MIPITFFMCVAAVAILRPLTKQLGRFLDVVTQQKLQTPAPRTAEQDNARVAVLLEQMMRKMDGMEERLDFTERLLAGNQRTIQQQLSVRDLPDVGLRQEPVHSAFR